MLSVATRFDRARWVAESELCLVEVQYEVGPGETYVLAERLEEPLVARAVLDQFRAATVPTEAGGALSLSRPTCFRASGTAAW